MFFYLSKILGFFLMPSNFLGCLLILGLVLTKTRHAHAGRKLLTGVAVALLVIGFSPLGNWLLVPLEGRFTQPLVDDKFPAPYGIIILGGSIDTVVSKGRGSIAINEAGERLVEAAKLARRFPKARILFSGGSGRILYESMSESDVAQKLFANMGISAKRLLFERRSKNTWQNARFTKDLLKSKSNRRWLLVTSAFHMARSVGCFQEIGMKVVPWPVDYRTRGSSDLYRFFNRASEGWKRMDIAVREWVGLAVYRMTGRIGSFFPSPTGILD